MSTTAYGTKSTTLVICEATNVPHAETATCERPLDVNAPCADVSMAGKRRGAAAVFAAIALTVALAGCTTTAAPVAAPAQPAAAAEPAPTPTPEALPPAVTFAPAGDSITAYGNPDLETWPTFAQADDLVLQGGFAAGGQKIGFIADNMTNCGCDVVVVMAGTNDVAGPRWATPQGQMSESLVRLVQNSGARHALIVAIAPRDKTGRLAGDPAWGDAWNAEQARLAAYYGWDYIDPWAFLRAADGQFLPGTTTDGVHPTEASQAELGAILHDAIVEVAR